MTLINILLWPLIWLIKFIVLHLRWVACKVAQRQGLNLQGLEHLPPKMDGVPMLMICNHEYYSEYLLLAILGGGRFKPWVKNVAILNIFRPIINALFKVRYTKSSQDLIQATIDDFKSGENYCITPEGTRNYGIGTRRGNVGLARLMLTCDPVVVPIGLSSEYQKGSLLSVFAKKKWDAIWGKPFRLANPTAKHSQREIIAITDEAMLRIVHLLPPEKHGYYRGMTNNQYKYTKDVDVHELIKQHQPQAGQP